MSNDDGISSHTRFIEIQIYFPSLQMIETTRIIFQWRMLGKKRVAKIDGKTMFALFIGDVTSGLTRLITTDSNISPRLPLKNRLQLKNEKYINGLCTKTITGNRGWEIVRAYHVRTPQIEWRLSILDWKSCLSRWWFEVGEIDHQKKIGSGF